MPSAYEHAQLINDYLKPEVELNCIAGPFKFHFCQNSILIVFLVIPKSTPGKWRWITDLSYPSRARVNFGVPEDGCHFQYPGIQETIDKIMLYGNGTLLAKFDLSPAYRCAPIHKENIPFLGMF